MSTTRLGNPAFIHDVASLNIHQIQYGLDAGNFKCLDLVKVCMSERPSTLEFNVTDPSKLQTYIKRIKEVNERCKAVIQIHNGAVNMAIECDQAYEYGKPRG